MSNTLKSFEDKWRKNPDLAFSSTLQEGSKIFKWILDRNGFSSGDDLRAYLKDKRRILDAGCGNGRVTALLRTYSIADLTEIIGIDIVSSAIAEKNLSKFKNIRIIEKDLIGDLNDIGTFDFIYCQEVLHHTPTPQRAFDNLCSLLGPTGEIAIYVYKKKAPIREFADDYIRERISSLNYEDASKICRQITELGKSLSEINIKMKAPEIDLLEIHGGEYDLQRFIYHFFMKCFWNPELSFNDNVAINYDWYHPQTCSRHKIEEVRNWFADANLKVVHEFVDFYGITVRGKRI